MHVAVLSLELHITDAQSLKAKRMVLRRITDRLKRFNVAVAEVAHQDLWQRVGLAVATVSASAGHAEQVLASVEDEIERVEPGLIVASEIEVLT